MTMAAGFQCGIVGLTDSTSIPAVAVVSPNLRVKTTLGFVSTMADVTQFPGPNVIGTWIVPAMRCTVGAVPAINATCTSIAFTFTPLTGFVPTGPMTMWSPDARASGS